MQKLSQICFTLHLAGVAAVYKMVALLGSRLLDFSTFLLLFIAIAADIYCSEKVIIKNPQKLRR